MNRKVVTLLLLASSLASLNANAQDRAACELYRQEAIQLQALLEQTYGEQRLLLRDMNADPEVRMKLVNQYINDPHTVRLRELLDRFRADRPHECGWWTEADGALN